MVEAVVEVRIGSLSEPCLGLWSTYKFANQAKVVNSESTSPQLAKKRYRFLVEKLLGCGDIGPEVKQLLRARFWFF